MSLPNSNQILDYISASSPQGLMSKFGKMQVQFGLHIGIEQIVVEGSGKDSKWYLFFRRDLLKGNDPILEDKPADRQ